MAPLDDNLVLENGTSFRIGPWIFIADGSGGFESRSIDQDLPDVSEVTKHRELDDFIDQLEEIRFSDETRIQRNQDQNTLRIRRGFGKTTRRHKARNFHEWKDSAFQLHPLH